jgi:hypothetical protein
MTVSAPHFAFAAIWAIFVALFAALAWKARRDSGQRFPRFQYRIPSNHNMQIGNVRFQDVINEFAERFDKHVDVMNETSQSAARWAFWANGVSCALALFGLVAEISSWRS